MSRPASEEQPPPPRQHRVRRSSSADGHRSSYRRNSRALSTDTRSLETEDRQEYLYFWVNEEQPPPNDHLVSRNLYIIAYDRDMDEVMASIIAALSGRMSYEQLVQLDDNDAQQEFSRGLPLDKIREALPPCEYYHKEGSDLCTVCLSEFKEGGKCSILPCNHRFHVKCIERWLIRRNACPICRQPAIKPG